MNNYIGLEAHGLGFKAHLTVMFLGDIDDERANYVKSALGAFYDQECYVERKSINLFGPNHDIPVVMVQPLDNSFELIHNHLMRVGIESISEHGFTPHITLDMTLEYIMIPKVIKLNKLYLSYKGDRYYA